MKRDVIICGDWLAILKGLPGGCVQCVVTSPPYWGLRDYKVGGQLGLEKTPAEYVAKLVEGFREVRRVMRDDATAWINLGDSYANARPRASFGDQGDNSTGKHGEAVPPRDWAAWDLKPKDLAGMPWRVAFALQADGWWLRSDIIWAKPNPMPESVRDRPTRAHEYIFLLTKSARYYYDQHAIREPHTEAGLRRAFCPSGAGHATEGSFHDHADDLEQGQRNRAPGAHPLGRNKRSVWTIPTQAYPEAHFATFPEKLVEPCILAGTSARGRCPECGAPWKRVVSKDRKPTRPAKGNVLDDTGMANRDPQRHVTESRTVAWSPTCTCGGAYMGGKHGECSPVPCLVLDPFMGSGTVALVAKRLGRDFIGIELNPDYVKLAEKRLRESCPLLLETGK